MTNKKGPGQCRGFKKCLGSVFRPEHPNCGPGCAVESHGEHPDTSTPGTRAGSYAAEGKGNAATKHLAVFWNKKGWRRYLMLHNSGKGQVPKLPESACPSTSLAAFPSRYLRTFPSQSLSSAACQSCRELGRHTGSSDAQGSWYRAAHLARQVL